MAADPWFRKYLDAAAKRARHEDEDVHVSELTLALDAAHWFRGGPDCG